MAATKQGHITEARAIPGIRWECPFKLFVLTGFGWICLGRYRTEAAARAAARRRQVELPPRPRTNEQRRRMLLARLG